MDTVDLVRIEYRFGLGDGREERFVVQLDPDTLEQADPPLAAPPDWCRLDFHQCPHCSLPASRAHCPVAVQLAGLVARLDDLMSYHRVDLEVVTAQRRVLQGTTVQMALGSLMGLLIATCGCPHTTFFKPMARFHLPLASIEETMYRAAATYLLCRHLCGNAVDGKDLEEIYRNVHLVNMAMGKRLRAADTSDASINALTLLDMYALAVPQLYPETLREMLRRSLACG